MSFNFSLSQLSNKVEQWAEVLISLLEYDFRVVIYYTPLTLP